MSGDIYIQMLPLLAAESSHEAVVKLLLESGANPGHRASSLSLFYLSSKSEPVPIFFQVRSKGDLEETQEIEDWARRYPKAKGKVVCNKKRRGLCPKPYLHRT
jgi:hypothetical protein